ncbi:PTS transporter subunit IIC [Dolosicoccus paucivorans]
MEQKLTAKEFVMNILNGLAIGSVVVLIPGALLSELFKYLASSSMPALSNMVWYFGLSNSVMAVVCGILIGLNFKFNPIQAASLGLATMVASGAVTFTPEGLVLAGTGDIINMGITAAIGALLILAVGNKLRAYTILVIPPMMLLIAGGIGHFLLPYTMKITSLVGYGVAQLLTLQPMLMSILIAMVFSVLIVSPITTVGVALAIGLAGLGSGAGNLGITVTGFAFAINGWTVNSKGTSVAHFIGSPKMSMPNVIKKPLILLPSICGAAIAGAVGSVLGILGTPMSAGFGISGLVGPINHLNLVEGGWSFSNILVTIFAFVVVPIAVSLFFKYLFMKVWPILSPNDYYLDI